VCPLLATDVITIDKTDENFRLLYNTKGRFVLHLLKHKQEAEVGAPVPSPPRVSLSRGALGNGADPTYLSRELKPAGSLALLAARETLPCLCAMFRGGGRGGLVAARSVAVANRHAPDLVAARVLLAHSTSSAACRSRSWARRACRSS
jgi:hypothetical protein